MVVRLYSSLISPDCVIDLCWLDGRGNDSGALGFCSTRQDGFLSSLIFLWKERKDSRITLMQPDESKDTPR